MFVSTALLVSTIDRVPISCNLKGERSVVCTLHTRRRTVYFYVPLKVDGGVHDFESEPALYICIGDCRYDAIAVEEPRRDRQHALRCVRACCML